ncbi:MAG: type II CAAX prenyl endopeptidase Rce1 family protein [Pyrinomonadaceae bacterium]
MTDHSASSIDDRVIALWEIVSVLTSCFIAEWFFLSFFARQRVLVILPALLAFFLILSSQRVRKETSSDLGLGLTKFWAATRLLIFPTIAVVLVILVISRVRIGGTLPQLVLRPRFLFVPFWAFFQQYVLQGYINRRAQIVFGRGWTSIAFVATVFACAHLPNPLLTVLTAVGGFVWAAVYQRQPNLLALALSHTAASITLALAVPPQFLNGLRVGFKYFG